MVQLLPRSDVCLGLLFQWLHKLLWMLLVVLLGGGGDDDSEGCELRAQALGALGAELRARRAGAGAVSRMQMPKKKQ